MRNFSVKLGGTYSHETDAGFSTLSGSFSTVSWIAPELLLIGANGEIGQATFFTNVHPDDADHQVSPNQAIQIIDVDNENDVIFQGVIWKSHKVWKQTEEKYEIIAFTTGDDLLRRIALHGQKRRYYTDEEAYWNNPSTVFAATLTLRTIDTPLIFNPDGEPNCSNQVCADGTTGNHYWIFEKPLRHDYNNAGTLITAQPWTLRKAVAYLLNTYRVSWAIDPASFNDTVLDIFTTYGDPVITNVNLEGKSMLHALAELLVPHNYVFYVQPGVTTQSIYFAFRGEGDEGTVRLPPRDASIASDDDADANLIDADIVADCSTVVNKLDVFGEPIVWTTMAHTHPPTPSGSNPPCMKLVPGWKHSDLVFAFDAADATKVNPYDLAFRRSYCDPTLLTQISGESDDDDGHTSYGVGRIWLVNLGEASEDDLENLTLDLNFAGASSNASDDFADDLDETAIDTRRLEKPSIYTTNAAGGFIRQEDIVVEMSLDNSANWSIVPREWYEVLPEGMGIIFTPVKLERLGVNIFQDGGYPQTTYWQSLYDTFYGDGDPTLQIRILCGVKSDAKINGYKTNDGTVTPLAVEAVYDAGGYRLDHYNTDVSNAIYYTKYSPTQGNNNDQAAIQAIASLQLENTNRMTISGKLVVVLNSLYEYSPGDVITQITNRASFSPPPTILRVVHHLQDQHTELVLDNQRVKTVINGKPLTQAETMREHYLRTSNVQDLAGATQKAFTGTKQSQQQSILGQEGN